MDCHLIHNLCEDVAFNIFGVFFKFSAQKTPWTETDNSSQFTYLVTSEEESLIPKSVPAKVSSHLPQPPVTSHQETYLDDSYQKYDYQYDNEKYEYQYEQEEQYQDEQIKVQESSTYQYQQQYQDEQKSLVIETQLDQTQNQDIQSYHHQQEQEQQQQQYQQEQLTYQHQQHNEMEQQQQMQITQQQPHPAQHQKQAAQQLQASMLTGAATLGSLMAGGAKKLGSLFGAAAAAVAPPSGSQPQAIPVSSVATSQYKSSVTPVSSFASTVPVTTSVPEVSSSVPASTTTIASTLPRTPSLRRQESIQRPPVRRIRTLPDAPEDLTQTSFDESAYEDEYHKTEYDQSIDRDRTSLDRYRDGDYGHDTIHEEVEERRLSEAPSSPRSPSLQKTASPTKSLSQMRKPSVDSYQSQTPSIIDRRTSQSSFHHVEKVAVPTPQDGWS